MTKSQKFKVSKHWKITDFGFVSWLPFPSVIAFALQKPVSTPLRLVIRVLNFQKERP